MQADISNPQSPRGQMLRRYTTLKTERSTWDVDWLDLGEQIQPWRVRFWESDQNRGGKKNLKIINGTPRRAQRILASGMMAGITNPARPWFRLTTSDPDLNESGPVKTWLDSVCTRILGLLAKSNIYNCLHTIYGDIGTFAVSACMLDEDDETVIRGHVLPIGQYVLANSARNEVDTLFREVDLTVAQLVERFGAEKCTPQVQQWHKNGNLDLRVRCLYALEPNRDWQPAVMGPAGKRWTSRWMEMAHPDPNAGFLGVSGYYERPILAPRWDTTGEDCYGRGSPGMDAIGDCRALQLLEKRKAQVTELVTRPPMVGPSSLRNQRASLVPGDVTYLDGPAGQKFEPAYVVSAQAIPALSAEVERYEQRISSAFYADLWLMLANNQGDITAEEVREKHEEKLLQLGPVLTRLEPELLNPLVDRAFGIGMRLGMFPAPPQELQGQTLHVEYTSILSQAQKLMATTGIERLGQFTIQLSTAAPEVLDNLDTDEIVQAYADAVGVSPKLIRERAAVAQLRAQRAQQQQAQQQGAAMMAAAKGVKDLSGANLESDNGLSRLLGGLGPVAGSAVAQ